MLTAKTRDPAQYRLKRPVQLKMPSYDSSKTDFADSPATGNTLWSQPSASTAATSVNSPQPARKPKLDVKLEATTSTYTTPHRKQLSAESELGEIVQAARVQRRSSGGPPPQVAGREERRPSLVTLSSPATSASVRTPLMPEGSIDTEAIIAAATKTAISVRAPSLPIMCCWLTAYYRLLQLSTLTTFP